MAPVIRADLPDAAFNDSTDLGAPIEGYKTAVEAGFRFLVVSPTATVRRVLAMTGMSDFFGLSATESGGRTGNRTG